MKGIPRSDVLPLYKEPLLTWEPLDVQSILRTIAFLRHSLIGHWEPAGAVIFQFDVVFGEFSRAAQ